MTLSVVVQEALVLEDLLNVLLVRASKSLQSVLSSSPIPGHPGHLPHPAPRRQRRRRRRRPPPRPPFCRVSVPRSASLSHLPIESAHTRRFQTHPCETWQNEYCPSARTTLQYPHSSTVAAFWNAASSTMPSVLLSVTCSRSAVAESILLPFHNASELGLPNPAFPTRACLQHLSSILSPEALVLRPSHNTHPLPHLPTHPRTRHCRSSRLCLSFLLRLRYRPGRRGSQRSFRSWRCKTTRRTLRDNKKQQRIKWNSRQGRRSLGHCIRPHAEHEWRPHCYCYIWPTLESRGQALCRHDSRLGHYRKTCRSLRGALGQGEQVYKSGNSRG